MKTQPFRRVAADAAIAASGIAVSADSEVAQADTTRK